MPWIQRKGDRRVFKLVQPNCFAAIAAAIAEAALHLPQQYRTAYVLARLEQEMRSANSLRAKAWEARRETYDGLKGLFEMLSMEDPLLAVIEIDRRMGQRRGFNLKRFLERRVSATAHQAIHAMAEIDTVHCAIRRFQVAKQDRDDAGHLVTRFRGLLTSLNACIDYSRRFRQRPPAGILKGHLQRLAKYLPGLAWCFMAETFRTDVGRDRLDCSVVSR
jgi:hypothetical protein